MFGVEQICEAVFKGGAIALPPSAHKQPRDHITLEAESNVPCRHAPNDFIGSNASTTRWLTCWVNRLPIPAPSAFRLRCMPYQAVLGTHGGSSADEPPHGCAHGRRRKMGTGMPVPGYAIDNRAAL